MKHTPGTWAWYDHDGNEQVKDFSRVGFTLRTVEIYKADPPSRPGYTNFDLPKFILTVEDEISEADAKLIVKGPQMLAMLKRTLKVLRKWGHEGADTYLESDFTYNKGIEPVERLIKEIEG